MGSPFDVLPCGYLAFTDDGRVRDINDALLQVVGLDRDALIGQHLDRILTPGARVYYQTHFFPLLRLRGHLEEVYFALRSGDGDVPMLVSAIREEGEPPLNRCAMIMMKHRSRFEGELVAAREKAERSSAMRARFLSMLSHDVRTPIQSISGFSEILLRGIHGDLSDSQRDDLTHIRDAAKQLNRLIDDILGFSRLESVQVSLEVLRIGQIVDRASQMMQLQFESSGIELVRDRAIDDVEMRADPERLQQILLNLLGNAAKFTPPGGTVRIWGEVRTEDVLLHVTDTGPGIAADDLEGIFDPFRQVGPQPHDPSRRGVGLGLSISRELAELMDGRVTVRSRPGEGSTFTITLPREAGSDATGGADVSGAGKLSGR